MYNSAVLLSKKGVLFILNGSVRIKQTTKDLIEVSRFFFRKISKITQQKAWKKLPFNIEVHGV